MEGEDYAEKLVEEAYVCMTTMKRTIRKKNLKFHIEDGELYYKQIRKGKVGFSTLCSLMTTLMYYLVYAGRSAAKILAE